MSGELDRRLTALAEAAELADGRLDPEVVEQARSVVRRAGQRLGLGLEATVVALAGPTGAGKSSLFNALAGSELTPAGVRRPTTSSASAAVWGDGSSALLDWLEVPRRHAIGDRGNLNGLVLLDLPDFDSVERSHRLEVERIIELVDVVAWVVDPQKYADAALHDRYLRPLAAYEETMLLVLNQADTLDPRALAACEGDLKRLLREDGLDGVPLITVSAREGGGLAELLRLLQHRVAARGAAVARLAADLVTVAVELGSGCGSAPAGVRRPDRDRLLAALSEAASVATVVRAVGLAHRRRGILETGWPPLRWVRRLRPDPLRRLRLSDRPQPETRTSLSGPTPVQRSQIAAATRTLAAGASAGLPDPWPSLARSAATAEEGEIADRLDRAVGGADLHMARPRWWTVAGLFQRLVAGVATLGALWLLALAVLGFVQLGDVVPTPDFRGFALPTLLLVGGLSAGLLFSFLTRMVNGAGARRRSRAAARSLRERIQEVAEQLILEPVGLELSVYERLCAEIEEAAGQARGRRIAGIRVPGR